MDSRETLLREMLHRFPDLPADTVRAHVNLYPRNRDALINELKRYSVLLKAANTENEMERDELLYSNFSDYEPSMAAALQSLPLPEPPPTLVITPPSSPEKTRNQFSAQPSSSGTSKPTKYVLSIAKGIDLGYEEFLLQNQRQRLTALEEAYKKNEVCLTELRKEVLAKERLLFERTLIQNPNNSPNNHVNITVDTLLELTQANRQLSVQNQCLVTEVDLQTDGLAPLGDLTRRKSFYDEINPGPRDPLVEIDPRTPSRNLTVSSIAGRNDVVSHRMLMTNRLGAADEEENDISWECVACTLKNHPELPFCEACSSPKPISQPLTARDSPLRMDPASRSSDSVNRSTAIASGMNNVTTSSVTSSHSGESSSHSKY